MRTLVFGLILLAAVPCIGCNNPGATLTTDQMTVVASTSAYTAGYVAVVYGGLDADTAHKVATIMEECVPLVQNASTVSTTSELLRPVIMAKLQSAISNEQIRTLAEVATLAVLNAVDTYVARYPEAVKNVQTWAPVASSGLSGGARGLRDGANKLSTDMQKGIGYPERSFKMQRPAADQR